MYAGRVTVGIGLVVAVVSTLMAMGIGAASGRLGGWWGGVIEWAVALPRVLPDVPVVLVLASLFGPGFWTTCLVLLALNGLRSDRVARSLTLSAKGSAGGAGASRASSAPLRLVAPAALSAVPAAAALHAGWAMRAEAALSYLGLGSVAPDPSWGSMLSNAQQYFFAAPWLVFYPGMLLFLTVLCFYLVGEGLRDALNPEATKW